MLKRNAKYVNNETIMFYSKLYLVYVPTYKFRTNFIRFIYLILYADFLRFPFKCSFIINVKSISTFPYSNFSIFYSVSKYSNVWNLTNAIRQYIDFYDWLRTIPKTIIFNQETRVMQYVNRKINVMTTIC